MDRHEKVLELMKLGQGDKIKLNDGREAIFTKLNRTKFVATMNDNSYSIPIEMFSSVVSKVDPTKKANDKKQLVASLKKGDVFFINKNGNAEAFKFEEVKGSRIIGINPISNGKVSIDMSFDIGRF